MHNFAALFVLALKGILVSIGVHNLNYEYEGGLLWKIRPVFSRPFYDFYTFGCDRNMG